MENKEMKSIYEIESDLKNWQYYHEQCRIAENSAKTNLMIEIKGLKDFRKESNKVQRNLLEKIRIIKTRYNHHLLQRRKSTQNINKLLKTKKILESYTRSKNKQNMGRTINKVLEGK
jgi:hypothetical protein